MIEKNNYSLLQHNTFGIDAATACFIEYNAEEELRAALERINTLHPGLPLLHIGGGSNLLFLENFQGIILHSTIKGIDVVQETDQEVFVRAGAGVIWDDFVAVCVEKGWAGVENLSLIPGEVGASAIQNIGAYGAEVKDVIHEVVCLEIRTGQKRIFNVNECQYAYRQSIFKGKLRGQYAVLSVVFRLNKTFTPNIGYGGIRNALIQKGIDPEMVSMEQLRTTIIEIRKEKLPNPEIQGNAGSFFMNPVVERAVYERLATQYDSCPHFDQPDGRVKIPAGWLIEQCGWKGKRLGTVGVHDKQALVLVNLGGATGKDVARLSLEICRQVYEQFGITIHPEVNFIGKNGLIDPAAEQIP